MLSWQSSGTCVTSQLQSAGASRAIRRSRWMYEDDQDEDEDGLEDETELQVETRKEDEDEDEDEDEPVRHS